MVVQSLEFDTFVNEQCHRERDHGSHSSWSEIVSTWLTGLAVVPPSERAHSEVGYRCDEFVRRPGVFNLDSIRRNTDASMVTAITTRIERDQTSISLSL